MSVNYDPRMKTHSGQGAFRFWCQKVLPLVYGDSLSYYEVLNKVVEYVNNVLGDGNLSEYVNQWMLDHPEVTTTVQDGAITYQKLNSSIRAFVTPEIFGAVGDGVTDDTEAFYDLLNYGKPVVIPANTYRITEPIIGENCKVISDDATYNNIKPIYPKEAVLKSFNDFAKVHNYSLGNNKSYVEAVAYNTKTDKLILAVRDYNREGDINKTFLMVMNPSTYAIESTHQYDFKIVNSICYNATTNKLLVECYNDDAGIHVIDADDWTNDGLMTKPDAVSDWLYWGYDNESHLYAATTKSEGIYYVKLYDDSFALVKEFDVGPLNTVDTQQAVQFYDGKIYQVTLSAILEIDVASESVNQLCFELPFEPEGMCFDPNGKGYLVGHNSTVDGFEYLYKYDPDYSGAITYSQNNTSRGNYNNVNLDYLIGDGEYNVSIDEVSGSYPSATYNYPTGEHIGILSVQTYFELVEGVAKMFTHQKLMTEGRVYHRYRKINKSWDNWYAESTGRLEIVQQSAMLPTPSATLYNPDYANGSNIYYVRNGQVVIFGGWINLKAGTIPDDATILSYLPTNLGINATPLFYQSQTGAESFLGLYDRNSNTIKMAHEFTTTGGIFAILCTIFG